jgi:hypothetical protein
MMATGAHEDDGWVYPPHHKNQQYISELMSFVHNRSDEPYPRNKTFSKEELLALRPSDIVRYLRLKAYNDPEPPTERSRPTEHRSGSLKKAKMGISWFMPNKGVPWLEGRGGNPTRHSSVNEVIKRIEALETRGLGASSNDKQAYNNAEFYKVLEIFRCSEDFNNRYKFPMMTIWGSHLIHRLDDTCHFKVMAPHGNSDFPFALKTKTKWSKNVRTMGQCPDQIVLASMDWRSCSIVWLSIYLELWLTKHPTALFLFTTNEHVNKGPNNLKEQYKNQIQRLVWSTEEFQLLKDATGDDATKGLGSTSNQKYSATKASTRGASDNQVEYRGRWVGDKSSRVV